MPVFPRAPKFHNRLVDTTIAQGSLVVLAWLDSTGGSDVAMAAVAQGRHLSPESVLSQLFPDGLAGAVRVLPWLEPSSRPQVPTCAYAAIVGDAPGPVRDRATDRGCVFRSGFALHPTPNDIARLEGEFRELAHDLPGVAVPRLLDAVRRPPATNDRIEINIFAGSATRGGTEIALSDGEFAIAAAMAMDRRALSRAEWCDTLWPERDLESAARLLKVYVHRIRTKFGTRRIVDTHGSGYRLGLDVRVDVRSLEALARKRNDGSLRLDAAQLRNVEHAFEGFRERRYRRLEMLDQFAELERRLIATGVELGRVLVHEALDAGDGPRALAIAEQLVAIDPYDDVATELLIRAQLKLGRGDAAASHFRRFCRTLHDELNLPPPQHLARLLQR
jgi:DNA-binding SARP family transcriptional activator